MNSNHDPPVIVPIPPKVITMAIPGLSPGGLRVSLTGGSDGMHERERERGGHWLWTAGSGVVNYARSIIIKGIRNNHMFMDA